MESVMGPKVLEVWDMGARKFSKNNLGGDRYGSAKVSLLLIDLKYRRPWPLAS